MGEGTIAGTIAVFFGLLSIGYAAYLHNRAARSQSWPRTEGTVTQVSVKNWGAVQIGTSSAWEERYLPVIQYTYTVRGRPYSGNRIVIGEVQPMPAENVHEFLRPYQAGMKVRVFYDPSTPAFAVLEKRMDNGTATQYAWIGIALLFAVVFFRFFWGLAS